MVLILTSRSPALNDSPTTPRQTLSSYYLWPIVTPRFDSRAELRHRCAPRPPIYHRYPNWLRLPARNWLCFLARYHRMERAGMHWTRHGAQAMLDVRSIHVNGDWDQYQTFRITREMEKLYPSHELVDGDKYQLAA